MNRENGHRYIGLTVNMIARRRGHRYAAKNGRQLPFYNALRKYGEDTFEWSEVAVFEDHDLALLFEEEMIAKHQPYYNVASGGQGGWFGRTHTDESKAKMRVSHLGNSYHLGKKHPPEAREKMRLAQLKNPQKYWLGKTRSVETARKISESKKGKSPKLTPRMEEARKRNSRIASAARRKPVICLIDGSVYPDAASAAAFYGMTLSLVRGLLRRGHTSRSGYRFAHMKGGRHEHESNVFV